MEKTEKKQTVALDLSKLFSKDNRVKVILALGLAGIALIFLSEVVLPPKTKPEPAAQVAANSNEVYVYELETKLTTLLSSVHGVGEAQVMITLGQGAEYVYASQNKVNSDNYQDFDGEQAKKTQVKSIEEETFLLADGPNGRSQPVVSTTLEPQVKGVVVVCQGGANPVVCARIVEAVTTVLGVGANQVCVIPKK